MDEWDLGHESAQRLMVHCYKGWNLLLYCMSMTLRYLKTNKAQVSQNKEVHMQCSCFIPLLHCFTFVSGNEIADLNCHIIAVCIFICFSHPHYYLKQTWLIDDITWIDLVERTRLTFWISTMSISKQSWWCCPHVQWANTVRFHMPPQSLQLQPPVCS